MTLRPEPYSELENERTFRALEEFVARAADRGVEPSTLAVAWVLSHPQVTAVVVGPRGLEQLESVLGAEELRLSVPERDELAQLFEFG
jgi:aryl-alcohol dehydrogenase-like predicted oxidoreductase